MLNKIDGKISLSSQQHLSEIENGKELKSMQTTWELKQKDIIINCNIIHSNQRDSKIISKNYTPWATKK